MSKIKYNGTEYGKLKYNGVYYNKVKYNGEYYGGKIEPTLETVLTANSSFYIELPSSSRITWKSIDNTIDFEIYDREFIRTITNRKLTTVKVTTTVPNPPTLGSVTYNYLLQIDGSTVETQEVIFDSSSFSYPIETQFTHELGELPLNTDISIYCERVTTGDLIQIKTPTITLEIEGEIN